MLRDFFKQADAQFVAMCDVNQDSLAGAIHLANQRYGNRDCRGYADFREVLEHPDIDAVLIAAPHHWHVAMGVAAAKAGKDMSMEKPMAMAMLWAWDLAAAVERYGVVFQFGTQQHSDFRFRHAAEVARSGRLGGPVQYNHSTKSSVTSSRACLFKRKNVPKRISNRTMISTIGWSVRYCRNWRRNGVPRS